MRNQTRHGRNPGHQSDSSYRRQGRERNERSEWYDRDPLDERSGYRDEEREYNSSRLDSSELRGYDDHYRYDQNYHNYYGSASYSPDRERQPQRDSSYDSDRYSRGQGAYGTSSSGRASWDTGINNENRSERRRLRRADFSAGGDYNDRYNDRTSGNSPYGATQGSWSPLGDESRNSFYGRGPRNFKRSDERIKEEVCEMLTRHSSIDAEDIDVEVRDGEVTLSGKVSERRMRHLAEDCAEQCFGVKDVVNNIRIKRRMDADVSDRAEFGSGSREPSASPSNTTAKKSSSPSASSNTPDTKNPNH